MWLKCFLGLRCVECQGQRQRLFLSVGFCGACPYFLAAVTFEQSNANQNLHSEVHGCVSIHSSILELSKEVLRFIYQSPVECLNL